MDEGEVAALLGELGDVSDSGEDDDVDEEQSKDADCKSHSSSSSAPVVDHASSVKDSNVPHATGKQWGDWHEYWDPNAKHHYYVNSATNSSSWELPAEAAGTDETSESEESIVPARAKEAVAPELDGLQSDSSDSEGQADALLNSLTAASPTQSTSAALPTATQEVKVDVKSFEAPRTSGPNVAAKLPFPQNASKLTDDIQQDVQPAPVTKAATDTAFKKNTVCLKETIATPQNSTAVFDDSEQHPHLSTKCGPPSKEGPPQHGSGREASINAAVGRVSASEETLQQKMVLKGPMNDAGDLAAFGQLSKGRTVLSLQDLRLESIAPLRLSVLPELVTLCLAGNEFADVADLSAQLACLESLTSLDLSRCRLKKLPLLERSVLLTNFTASDNAVTSAGGLQFCTDLHRVDLRSNRLRRVDQLETLQLLEELDVSYNQLGPTLSAALSTVAFCRNLRVISVAGNPLAKVRAHRAEITNLIPSLLLVDDWKVKDPRNAGRATPSSTKLGYGALARKAASTARSTKTAKNNIPTCARIQASNCIRREPALPNPGSTSMKRVHSAGSCLPEHAQFKPAQRAVMHHTQCAGARRSGVTTPASTRHYSVPTCSSRCRDVKHADDQERFYSASMNSNMAKKHDRRSAFQMHTDSGVSNHSIDSEEPMEKILLEDDSCQHSVTRENVDHSHAAKDEHLVSEIHDPPMPLLYAGSPFRNGRGADHTLSPPSMDASLDRIATPARGLVRCPSPAAPEVLYTANGLPIGSIPPLPQTLAPQKDTWHKLPTGAEKDAQAPETSHTQKSEDTSSRKEDHPEVVEADNGAQSVQLSGQLSGKDATHQTVRIQDLLSERNRLLQHMSTRLIATGATSEPVAGPQHERLVPAMCPSSDSSAELQALRQTILDRIERKRSLIGRLNRA